MKKIGYRMINENSGITLISLVVTIIVIIILASIGINTGITTLKSSQLTRFTSQMKMMQLEVNELYEKYITGGTVKTKEGTKFVGEGILNIGKELTQADQEQISKIFRTTAEGGSNILDETGYRYFDTETISSLKIDGIDQEFLVNVQKRSFISFLGFKYNNDMYYTLEQLPDGLYNVGYINPNTGKPTFDVNYEKLTNGKWKINISNIKYEEGQEGYITKWNVKYQLANTEKPDKWYTSEELSFIVDTTGKYRILIYQQDVQSQIVEIDISDATVKPGEIVTGGNKEYTDETGTAVIPEGFAVVTNPDKIENGLVISDKPNDDLNNTAGGNQFVWIPVKAESEYVRNTSYMDINVSPKAYTDKGYLPEGIQPNLGGTETETQIGLKNEQAEREAVLKSGGFYISRYEAGKEGTDKLVSKKRATVWTSINQEDAKTTAKTMYNTAHVKSALCSGIQWDMVMKFVDGKNDGTGKTFNVKTVSSTRHVGSNPTTSGKNEADKVCNIYDLEGNCREYVSEKNTYYSGGPYVYRGGDCGIDSYGVAPASNRGYYFGFAENSFSFRLTLYVI